jgi:hypothetical protein
VHLDVGPAAGHTIGQLVVSGFSRTDAYRDYSQQNTANFV